MVYRISPPVLEIPTNLRSVLSGPRYIGRRGVLGFGYTLRTVVENKVRNSLSFVYPLLSTVTPLVFSWVDYMNGFRCQVTGSVSNVSLAPVEVPRRCTAHPQMGIMDATPGKRT